METVLPARPGQPRLRWFQPQLRERRAGTRYRCIYPIQGLRALGADAGLWQAPEHADVLVIDAWSLFPTQTRSEDVPALLETVRALQRQGTCIVLDNCDNQFAGEQVPGWAAACSHLRELARAADGLVCCSTELAQRMQRQAGLDRLPQVIGDPVETRIAYLGDHWLKSLASPARQRARWRVLQHRARLQAERRQGTKSLVWFGSHGNDFADGGMLDLKRVTPLLTDIHREHPLSLTVISNHRGKFESSFAHLAFRTCYLEWDRVTFLDLLRMHDIALLPSSPNEFTVCKSANRLVLALHHGLNVVADDVPSYREFGAAATIGDWEGGLRRYLSEPEYAARHRAEGAALVAERCSHERVARQWRDALLDVLQRARP